MKARFLKRVVWYTSVFESGEVHDLDNMVYAKLLRQHIIEPFEEPAEAAVEQPEKPIEAIKPVVTARKPMPRKKRK